MSSWAFRRQILILFVPIVLFIGGVYLFYTQYLYRTPTCTDGRQNGLETGVDCGGGCSLVCSDQAINPVILWSKAFQVTGTVYNAVAYIQNPNTTSRASQVPYEFRLFDTDGLLVASRKGVIDIAPGKTFAIFEGGIQVASGRVKRTDFAFNPADSAHSAFVWTKDTSQEPPIVITHGSLENPSTTPRLSGQISNPNVTPIGSTELVALISDDRGNTINASKTVVDPLAPQASVSFVFTWPRPIGVGTSTVIEIISRPL